MTFTLGNQNSSSLIWANYVDLEDDVKPWLQIQTLATGGDLRLQLLIDMTCQWVQNKMGRAVGPTPFKRRFNGWSGWNGAYIELPYAPILEVTSVTEWWGSSGPHVLGEQTPENQVDGWQCDYLRGQLIRVFPGLVQKPWFPGSRNIEVSWVAGYNPVPADIKVATLEMIAHWWRNTQQQAGGNRFSSSSEYDPEVVSSGLWQGTPLRITALLDSYQQIGMG